MAAIEFHIEQNRTWFRESAEEQGCNLYFVTEDENPDIIKQDIQLYVVPKSIRHGVGSLLVKSLQEYYGFEPERPYEMGEILTRIIFGKDFPPDVLGTGWVTCADLKQYEMTLRQKRLQEKVRELEVRVKEGK